ncbi:MAG: reverse transcriptase domain-containing protein [Bacteroidota bacterium]
MSEQPRTRQELYDLIRSSSREEFILLEMQRLGFWQRNADQPSLPAYLIERKTELQKELRELSARQRKLEDPEKLLAEYRKKRMAESREQQRLNREKRERDRQLRTQLWERRKQREILYLGEEVSKGLSNKASLPERLQRYQLPDFRDAEALAQAMQISVGELRFLAYHRRVSKVNHYQRFYLPKKSGGQRLISAPMPRLKAAQYWIMEHILQRVPIHEKAHGFAPERSILSNARDHVGQELVLNFDFKDFFPTINYPRVKGLFKNLGYSDHIATILSVICTEPEVQKVELDGQHYFVARGDRKLPQGAPSSPVITNILCYRLDRRLSGAAQKLGYAYTRYADDLSFSASGEAARDWAKLKWRIERISEDEGFKLHPDKFRLMRRGGRQEVTGLVVNDQLGVDRRTLRKFRALLHQIKRDGWEGKKWGSSPNVLAAVWGYANFVRMVKPEQGQRFIDTLKSLTPPKNKPSQGPKLDFKWPKKATDTSQANRDQDQKKDRDRPPKKDRDRPFWKLW